MNGEELFKKLLLSGRLVVLIQTDTNEVTMAAYHPGSENMTETLEAIQRQAKAVGKLVVLDLSLMDERDFDQVNPQDNLLQ